MAKPRVFVSSTCYDLGVIRSELRPFIESMGYEPVMSDYSDILYDPDQHSHESCIKQIIDCDLIILIIGSRFGGKAVSPALENIDFDKVIKMSVHGDTLSKDMSITQAEVVTAIEHSIPIYPFIDHKVYHEQHIYEENRNKGNDVKNIYFPSIEKQKTARYIFDFIRFIRGLQYNNGVYEFATVADIKAQLTKQWAAYFKELLRNRHHYIKNKEVEQDLSRRFDDLKEAIISSIDDSDRQDKVRKMSTYRSLISFVSMIGGIKSIQQILLKETSWDKLIAALGIIAIKEIPLKTGGRPKAILLRKNDHYRCNYSIQFIHKMEEMWNSFAALEQQSKEELVKSFSAKEMDSSLPLEYVNEKFK